MRLDIDWTRCTGNGLCTELDPDRITRDEWGFPILRHATVSPAEERAARRTVTLCPALALRLTT